MNKNKKKDLQIHDTQRTALCEKYRANSSSSRLLLQFLQPEHVTEIFSYGLLL